MQTETVLKCPDHIRVLPWQQLGAIEFNFFCSFISDFPQIKGRSDYVTQRWSAWNVDKFETAHNNAWQQLC